MYKKTLPTKTSIAVNTSYEGETIEQKINRIVNNKEPIKDGAPIIYTDRKDGVRPEYDIRTDRFELAVEGMDFINKSKLAKRDENLKERGWTKDESGKYKPIENGNSGAEPLQGTDTK